MNAPEDADVVLDRRELAALLRVSPETVTAWARAGKIPSFRTVGGHRRYRRGEVLAALKEEETP